MPIHQALYSRNNSMSKRNLKKRHLKIHIFEGEKSFFWQTNKLSCRFCLCFHGTATGAFKMSIKVKRMFLFLCNVCAVPHRLRVEALDHRVAGRGEKKNTNSSKICHSVKMKNHSELIIILDVINLVMGFKVFTAKALPSIIVKQTAAAAFTVTCQSIN